MGEDTRSPRTVVSDKKRRWGEEDRDVYVRRCAFRLQKLFELSIAKSDMIVDVIEISDSVNWSSEALGEKIL